MRLLASSDGAPRRWLVLLLLLLCLLWLLWLLLLVLLKLLLLLERCSCFSCYFNIYIYIYGGGPETPIDKWSVSAPQLGRSQIKIIIDNGWQNVHTNIWMYESKTNTT